MEGGAQQAPPSNKPLLSAGLLAVLCFGVHVVSTLVFFGMFLKVIPVFQKTFAEVGAELPLPTQVLLSLADSMASFGLVLFPLVALALLLDGGLLLALVRSGRRQALGLLLAASLTACPLFVVVSLLVSYLPIYSMTSTIGG
ncbi:MAG: hypothetical protein VX498_11565 [Myxococcota bacterium]|nr:hypothetical protein [Myxococcota bacterium]